MLVLFLVLASVACLLLGMRYLRQALAITGTAASYIRSAAQGYVVLVGEGVPLPGRSMLAPFSSKPCVWWSTQVETLLIPADKRIAPSGDAFNKRFSTQLFLLRDGSGECLVDPSAADVRVKSRDVWYGSSMSGEPANTGRRTRSATDDLRFVEERIELHQRIVASGYFRTAHVDQGAKQGPATAPGTNTLGPAPDGREFLISTVPEETLARDLRRRAVMALLACAVLAGWAMLAGRAA
jgi:hypothetical protein